MSSKKLHDKIIIRGARVNNLVDVNIDIPKDKLVVITGLSGSGKSSLAFDTIFAEGNRRYVESLSSYARNFLNVSAKPDVEKIENLSPSIAIDQKSINKSPRSTVGTLTEVYDYLRIIFAKLGSVHCPECGALMQKKSNKEIVEEISKLSPGSKIAILFKSQSKETSVKNILRSVQSSGYSRVFFNGRIMTVSEALMIATDDFSLDVYVVVDRMVMEDKKIDKERVVDSIETSMKMGKGSMKIIIDEKEERFYNRDYVCHQCQLRVKEVGPQNFSFNSPDGACAECSGLGKKMEIDPDLVIPNKNLSLSEGAIRPWSKSGGKTNGNNGNGVILESLSREYGISLDIPIKKMSVKNLDLILYGNGKIIEGKNDLGGIKKKIVFEGIIPTLEKKYNETKSDYLRREIEKYMNSRKCPACNGKRLKDEYLSILINNSSIDDLVSMDVVGLRNFLADYNSWEISQEKKKVAEVLIREIIKRLEILEDVGLEYLNMSRSAETISGGEAQRIRLAVQINSQLSGIIYVLDEPSIGLHSRDTEKLIKTMKELKNAGNSVVVVEHDPDIMKSSDWIIDMGPGAGEEGGKVIFEGTPKEILRAKTSTSLYLNGRKKVSLKKKPRATSKKSIKIIKAEENNLKEIDVQIPLERLVVICGVSGSGKSTLVSDILVKALAKKFYNAKAEPGKFKDIKGLDNINKVIGINQDPIGQTPRSNAATYTGVFSHIRELFSQVEEAKTKGYTPSHFSFNMKGGRCEVCQGEGYQRIEMHLLPDMYVKCETCGGARYSNKILEIEYQGVNISQVLDMSVSYALRFFKKHPLIVEKLKTMEDVGLGYLKLGQSATNLSGGEAQRIKLATELSRKSTGKTLYILDEPTIGLHFDDISKLLNILESLVEKGNSVLVVEHNLDVIRSADWVIELGPDGGKNGGEIVFEGFPEKLKKNKKSWTAKYL